MRSVAWGKQIHALEWLTATEFVVSVVQLSQMRHKKPHRLSTLALQRTTLTTPTRRGDERQKRVLPTQQSDHFCHSAIRTAPQPVLYRLQAGLAEWLPNRRT